MSLQMMSSAPLASQQTEFAQVLDGATAQLGIADFATWIKLVQFISAHIAELTAIANDVQAVIAKIVALWKELNPPAPPNVP